MWLKVDLIFPYGWGIAGLLVCSQSGSVLGFIQRIAPPARSDEASLRVAERVPIELTAPGGIQPAPCFPLTSRSALSYPENFEVLPRCLLVLNLQPRMWPPVNIISAQDYDALAAAISSALKSSRRSISVQSRVPCRMLKSSLLVSSPNSSLWMSIHLGWPNKFLEKISAAYPTARRCNRGAIPAEIAAQRENRPRASIHRKAVLIWQPLARNSGFTRTVARTGRARCARRAQRDDVVPRALRCKSRVVVDCALERERAKSNRRRTDSMPRTGRLKGEERAP